VWRGGEGDQFLQNFKICEKKVRTSHGVKLWQSNFDGPRNERCHWQLRMLSTLPTRVAIELAL
jgi:hypothetical protein